MTIRELSDSVQGEKVQIIELSGDEARVAYHRMINLRRNLNTHDLTYIAGYRNHHASETCEIYQVLNSTVHLTISYDPSHPESVALTKIRIANSNPDYRKESLIRLEGVMEMRLRKGRRPAVITAQA